MKITKKQIKETIKTENISFIFNIAKKNGIDVNSKFKVMDFIDEFSTSKKLANKLTWIIFKAQNKEVACDLINPNKTVRLSIKEAIDFAKKSKGINDNYSKILIAGSSHIFWASEYYRLKDYNKAVAFVRNDKNIRVASLINSYLNK